MAARFHQLGIDAERQGAYDEALEWYRKALPIFGELDDRPGVAATFCQVGALLTERGTPQEAVAWNLRSLAIRLDLQAPQFRLDVHWLGRQRELLGNVQFGELVAEHAGAEAVEVVLGMLEQAAKEE